MKKLLNDRESVRLGVSVAVAFPLVYVLMNFLGWSNGMFRWWQTLLFGLVQGSSSGSVWPASVNSATRTSLPSSLALFDLTDGGFVGVVRHVGHLAHLLQGFELFFR